MFLPRDRVYLEKNYTFCSFLIAFFNSVYNVRIINEKPGLTVPATVEMAKRSQASLLEEVYLADQISELAFLLKHDVPG